MCTTSPSWILKDLLVFPSSHNNQDAICLWFQREETDQHKMLTQSLWHSDNKASMKQSLQFSFWDSGSLFPLFVILDEPEMLDMSLWKETFLDWPSVMIRMPPSNTLNTVILPPSLVRVSTMQSPSEMNVIKIIKTSAEYISECAKHWKGTGKEQPFMERQTQFDFPLSVIVTK